MSRILRAGVGALLLVVVSHVQAQAGEPGQSGAAPPAFEHGLLEQVLQARVDTAGLVDYAGLTADRGVLDAYVDSLGRVSPQSHPARFPTRDHELAYWMNAYNAFVLRGVVDGYPVDSVKDLGLLNGFFRRKTFVAGGREMTLDHIENEIIRPQFREPRIHFAVNCAALSCPALGQRAFRADSLEAQLEAGLVRFARDPMHVRWTGDGLRLSKILDWYGQDFVDWFPAERTPQPEDPTLVDYLLPYLPEETARQVRARPTVDVDFLDYDWALNDQSPPN